MITFSDRNTLLRCVDQELVREVEPETLLSPILRRLFNAQQYQIPANGREPGMSIEYFDYWPIVRWFCNKRHTTVRPQMGCIRNIESFTLCLCQASDGGCVAMSRGQWQQSGQHQLHLLLDSSQSHQRAGLTVDVYMVDTN